VPHDDLSQCTWNNARGIGIPQRYDLEHSSDCRLATIQQRRQQLVDERLVKANLKQFSYDNKIGDEVLKLVYKPDN
jgi:hypothetical protein